MTRLPSSSQLPPVMEGNSANGTAPPPSTGTLKFLGRTNSHPLPVTREKWVHRALGARQFSPAVWSSRRVRSFGRTSVRDTLAT